MTVKGEWGKMLDIIRKVIGDGQPAICVVFPLALLSEVAMFALSQCFSIFQQERICQSSKSRDTGATQPWCTLSSFLAVPLRKSLNSSVPHLSIMK
jgi:hypothetical protein